MLPARSAIKFVISFGLALTLTYCSSVFARGTAVCIGLNAVDPDHYAGWAGKLIACENDATDMLGIAKQNGFEGKTILTKSATRDAVLSELDQAAGGLKAGDIFLLMYSGHGGQIPDDHANPADNGMDQTWCLYDGELLDKELYAKFSKFPQGVRILVFSDSCHSAGITKMKPGDFLFDPKALNLAEGSDSKKVAERFDLLSKAFAETGGNAKAIQPVKSVETYLAEKDRYDKIVKDLDRPAPPINPWVLSLAACKNEETADDGMHNSVFTAAVISVWDGGNFSNTGTYVIFHDQVAAKATAVNAGQHAQRRMIDQESQNYWNQRPFTVLPPPP